MKNMLECLTMASLKKLAENKEISIKGSISKSDLIEAILPVIEKPPANVFRLYHSLENEDKDLVNYLLVHGKKSNLSEIFKTVQPKRWHGPRMREVKSILTRLIPAGLVCFKPPPLYYWGSNKEEEYYFYVPEEIKKAILVFIISPVDKAPEPGSIKSRSAKDIIRAILLKKINSSIVKELSDSICKISVLMEDSINIDGFGIYSNHRKGYFTDRVALYNSLVEVAAASLTEAEKRLHSFASNLPADKWFNEGDVLKVINKYTNKNKCIPKTRLRLYDLGLIKTAKFNNLNLISRAPEECLQEAKTDSGRLTPEVNFEPGGICVKQDRLRELSLKALFTILKYFCLSESGNEYVLTLSLQKIGHALESGEDTASIKRTIAESIRLSGEEEKRFDAIEKNFGNFLLHKNTVVYRVNDPSIYYKIEKSTKIKSPLLYLEGKYLLIPAKEQKDVERFIKQAGFVIKEEKESA